MSMAPFNTGVQSATCSAYAPRSTQAAAARLSFSPFCPFEEGSTGAWQGGSPFPAFPMASGVDGKTQSSLQRHLNSPANMPPKHTSASLAAAVLPCDSAVVLPDFMSFGERASLPGPEILSERRKSNTRLLNQDTLAQGLQTDGFDHDADREWPRAASTERVCECSEQLPDLIALLDRLQIETPKGFGGIFSSGHEFCAPCSEIIKNHLKGKEAMGERPMRNLFSSKLNKNKIRNKGA